MTLLNDLEDKIKKYSETGQSKFYEYMLDAAQQYEDQFWDLHDNQINHTSLALLLISLEERIDDLEEQLRDVRRELS